ncbi:cytoplasmic 60S subunit biogenesis factor REI1 homolog 2-like [Typha angustifolia]|uniref:cytoplasmic 60S subunit biogenesis factor REI1 homolog 2-like n=1 Tax=Typha angustifolia TaxID=59011 RepID=UPI003C30C402
MPSLTCNACNAEFVEEAEQKVHYRSEWHRYNLKRKVAGVPGVTEALFQARQSALAEERNNLSATPMSYGCPLCGKEYRSSKAHAQHLKSRAHVVKAAQDPAASTARITIVKPLPDKSTSSNIPPFAREEENDESEEDEDEWVEVDSHDDIDMANESLSNMHVDERNSDDDMEEFVELDPSCCFMCDIKHDTIENCIVHMHKKHGFFIPDVEYLKDLKGLLAYVGLKVKRDFICLFCNERCHPFQSLEAVRKHMVAKGHCKLRYGDGGDDDEDADLEEFYDYSSSYVDADGKQLVVSNDMNNNIELGSGGCELIISQKTSNGSLVKTLGSREFLRYYRQKPRPSPAKDIALALSLASRYRSMGLATVQSKQQLVRLKVLREMNRTGVEAMRTKMGMKSNVIRNLPKNVPY